MLRSADKNIAKANETIDEVKSKGIEQLIRYGKSRRLHEMFDIEEMKKLLHVRNGFFSGFRAVLRKRVITLKKEQKTLRTLKDNLKINYHWEADGSLFLR